MTKQILKIAETTEVSNYPYGSLKCRAFFSIEFDSNKGFRSVFQTINPKNDRLNAPKKSTYSDFVCNYKDAETGHIKAMHFDVNSYERVNELFAFLNTNQYELQLSAKMVESICLTAIASIKANAMYTKVIEAKHLLNVLEKPVKALVSMVKLEVGVTFEDVVINVEKIERLKKEWRDRDMVTALENKAV